jgi:hypothetical protein
LFIRRPGGGGAPTFGPVAKVVMGLVGVMMVGGIVAGVTVAVLASVTSAPSSTTSTITGKKNTISNTTQPLMQNNYFVLFLYDIDKVQ